MILKYNEEIQKVIGSKTKPEPWMHVAIIKDSINANQIELVYAIYVWDTRQIIESNIQRAKLDIYDKLQDIAEKYRANDNHEQLIGRLSENVTSSEFFPKKPVNLSKVKIKYTPIDKTTYDTNKSSLAFVIEINGIRAKGFWSPISGYTVNGVDVNELTADNGDYQRMSGRRFDIFDGGGSSKSYEISSYDFEPNEKQPKNLRFTGKYYNTGFLGNVITDSIRNALSGNNKNTKLSKEFMNFFKLN